MWKTTETEKKLFKILEENKEIIIFDTETTGLSSKKNRIIQISGIKCSVTKNDKGMFEIKEIASIDKYIRPITAIDEKVEELTGITNDFIMTQPEEEDVIDEIFAFFGDSPFLFGYNVNFDVKFLYELYKRNELELKNCVFDGEKFKKTEKEIDILKMARDLIDKKDITDYKLSTVAEMYGFASGVSFHSSLEDAKVTKKLLEMFIYDYQTRNVTAKTNEKQKEKVKLKNVGYWNRYGYKMERIYINNEFYYSVYNKEWGVKSGYNIDDYDMEDLRKQVLNKYNVNDEDELLKAVKKEYKEKQK